MSRARVMRQDSCNGIVRRIVSLPRSIVGGFSRVMGHGIGRIGGRKEVQTLPSNVQFQYPPETLTTPEEWAFLTSFEQEYGTEHPFFYACNYMEALKIAENENKLMFMYLHSPQHPFTPSFCRGTLCSELVVQFLDANFVCWAGLADRGEGLQMAATLQPASFPCCALVAPAAGNSIAVLQQIEGPVSPAELLEILQRTIEEQGLAFGITRVKGEKNIRTTNPKEEEKMKADRQLREEQDAAYLAALKIDKEKENLRNFLEQQKIQKPMSDQARKKPTQKQYSKGKEASTSWSRDSQVTQILIRFPNGERREQSFCCSDKVEAVFKYVDSLGILKAGNYRLVSSFPRRVFSFDQLGMFLKESGLYPKATLFIELM